MKSLEQQLSEAFDSLITAGKKSFVTELIAETGVTIEQKLSRAIAKCRELRIREAKPVLRKNGSRFSESAAGQPDKETRIAQCAKDFHVSFREASLYLGFGDPGVDVKESDSAIKERADRWRKYTSLITENDAMTLAKRGVEPF